MDSPISAKAALLQVLVSAGGYGLDLIDRVKTRTEGQVALGQGSVYPALRTLEREGLVRSYEGVQMPERGGRRRRYYKLTAAGRRVAIDHSQILATFFSEEV